MIKPLSDEAIIIAVCGECPFEGKYTDEDCHACQRQLKAIAQEAQRDTLRQVAEWGIEICTEHLPKWQGHVDLMGGVLSRRECPKCWQELKEQVK